MCNVLRHTVRYAASFLLVIAMTAGVALAADDPFIGKWQLDLARSKYETGDIPKGMTITMETTDRGIHYRSETIFSNDRHSTTEYTANYDERLATVQKDSGLAVPVSLKRVDDHTVVAKFERAFKTIATSTRVISDDGRTMTITTAETPKENDKDGKAPTTVLVFRRAE